MNKIYLLTIKVTEENPEYSEKAETDFLDKQRYSNQYPQQEKPHEASRTRERYCLQADIGPIEFEVLKQALISQITRTLEKEKPKCSNTTDP